MVVAYVICSWDLFAIVKALWPPGRREGGGDEEEDDEDEDDEEDEDEEDEDKVAEWGARGKKVGIFLGGGPRGRAIGALLGL